MIAIVNGPNLNMLGRRKPEVYGHRSFEDFLSEAELFTFKLTQGRDELEYYQSNSEGELIDILQKLGTEGQCRGIVMNPGAYAHYSYAIRDAVESIETPVVEVHISNIHAREEFRHTDVIAPVCRGMICGLGLEGYLLAIQHLCK